MDRHLGQVLCPLVTPFKRGDIDETAFRDVIRHVTEAGVDGLVPCGTTGEFASLSESEYERVVELTVNEAPADVSVLVGTATPSVPNTLERIDRVADIGADAALITLPYFHTANDPNGNKMFIEAIADETTLPIYLYNIPVCTGEEISLDTLTAVADHDAIRGLKDSSGDFRYLLEAKHRTGQSFSVYQGFDSLFVPSLEFGVAGGVNALSNAIPEAFIAVANALEANDHGKARRIQQEQISPLFDHCLTHGFGPTAKAALASREIMSNAAVRPPLVQPDRQELEQIDETVEEVTAAMEYSDT